MKDKESNEEELPKLTIREENEFKKLKLALEHGIDFPDFKLKTKLSPEIEGQFLDHISNFESAFLNAKQITVYEKIGKPVFKPAATLSDDEITVELEKIEKTMHRNNLNLDVLCDYENKERLIYSFITEELFLIEIDDMNVLGMRTNFIYEEFHQNHKYDLELATEDFLKMFFNKKSDFYDQYHSKDALNQEELNNFRSLFKKFKMNFFDFYEITFDEQNAKAEFNIDFWAKIKGTDAKISYSGDGSMTFEYKYGYWYVKNVNLPIND
jgi:hypothetical protein